MKKQRIDLWKNKRNPTVYRQKPLPQIVSEMVQFFNGYEYDNTAVVMSYQDYRSHAKEFTGSGNNLKLAGFPVYLNGILPSGQIHLTTIEAAENLMDNSDTEAI